MSLPITGSLPRPEVAVVARRRLGIQAQMGVGAIIGLLVATQTGDPQTGPRLGLTLMVLGALAGAVHSYWRLPDAPVCRIPWWLRGCGGSNAVRDTDGNSRPKPPCWGHPDGKPKRIVNLLVVCGEIAACAVLLVVLMTAVSAAP